MENKYKYLEEDISPIKEAAIKFDIFIRDGGVGASLFFILLILIIVNAHSLHFLFGDGAINWVFSVVGAIGFSVATTAVIRKPVSSWMKWVFPLFDTILVLLGFNILDGVEVKIYLIIVFSLFTGAILISLGTINYKENSKLDTDKDKQSEIDSLNLTIETLNLALKSGKSELKSLSDTFNQVAFEKDEYKKVYLAAERSRILKKKQENRTEKEIELLNNLNYES